MESLLHYLRSVPALPFLVNYQQNASTDTTAVSEYYCQIYMHGRFISECVICRQTRPRMVDKFYLAFYSFDLSCETYNG